MKCAVPTLQLLVSPEEQCNQAVTCSPEGTCSGSAVRGTRVSASVNLSVWSLSHVHLPEKQELFDLCLLLPAKLSIMLHPHPQEYLHKPQAFTGTV